ncbi:MAG: SusC/RagA family TonB-linked outer membrane protein, partial [Butyricimonas faecihominis]
LNIEGTASYTIGNTHQEVVYEEDSWYILKLRGNSDGVSLCPVGGELQTMESRNNNWMIRLQLNYNQLFQDKHLLNVSLGGEVSSKESLSQKTTARGYYPDRGKSFGTISATDGQNLWQLSRLVGFNKLTIGETLTNMASLLTVSYTYDNR